MLYFCSINSIGQSSSLYTIRAQQSMLLICRVALALALVLEISPSI